MHGMNPKKLSFVLRNRGASRLDFTVIMGECEEIQFCSCLHQTLAVLHTTLSPASPVTDFFYDDSWLFSMSKYALL